MFSRFFRAKKPPIKKSDAVLPASEKPAYEPFPITWVTQNTQGNLALSQAPGKKMEKGRNGKKYERDLALDVNFLKENHKISTILCLIGKYELRTIGVNLDEYKKFCEKNGVCLYVYPIVEMGVPEEDVKSFHSQIIKPILEELHEGKNVLVHCRGGIGRAGTLAACLLLSLGLQKTVIDAVLYLRKVRDRRCVESRKQFDFLQHYCEFYHSILCLEK